MKRYYLAASFVFFLLGFLVWQDSALLGKPRSSAQMRQLPTLMSRPDVAFERFVASDISKGRYIAVFRIDGNEIVFPSFGLPEDGCRSDRSCMMMLSDAVVSAEARTTVATAIESGFAACNLRPAAMRHLSVVPTRNWSNAKIDDLIERDLPWNLRADVLLDVDHIGPDRTAFANLIQTCTQHVRDLGENMWRPPDAVILDVYLATIDENVASEADTGPKLVAWNSVFSRHLGGQRDSVSLSVEADQLDVSMSIMKGDFAFPGGIDKPAMEAVIFEWVVENVLMGNAEDQHLSVSLSRDVRAVGSDPQDWRVLAMVTIEPNDYGADSRNARRTASFALTYNQGMHTVRDLVMIHPFAGIHQNNWVDWPPDGGLYMP